MSAERIVIDPRTCKHEQYTRIPEGPKQCDNCGWLGQGDVWGAPYMVKVLSGKAELAAYRKALSDLVDKSILLIGQRGITDKSPSPYDHDFMDAVRAARQLLAGSKFV